MAAATAGDDNGSSSDACKLFRWRIVGVDCRNVREFHRRSEAFRCKVSPSRTLEFRLAFDVVVGDVDDGDEYEVSVLSLARRETTLKLACSLRSNALRRSRKPFELALAPAATSDPLLRGKMDDLFGPDGLISLPDVLVELVIFTTNKYPSPDFPFAAKESGAVALENCLAADMADAFEKETDANLTVVCRRRKDDDDEMVEAARFRVQRGVLSARSRVFAAMFSHDFVESSEHAVHVDDLSPAALRQLLLFFYTDRAPQLDDHAEELLAASDKYDVPRLKLLCQRSVCEGLDHASVSRALALVAKHDAADAKEFCMRVLVDNFPDVVETDGWRTLATSAPDLLHEVHREIARRMAEAEAAAEETGTQGDHSAVGRCALNDSEDETEGLGV